MAFRSVIAAFRNPCSPRRRLSERFQSVGNIALSTVLTLSCAAQIPSALNGQSSASASQQQLADSLGRSTPRGTITAFIRAVHHNDFVSAARYMQITPKQRSQTEALARDLKDLMDRYFSEPLAVISDSAQGALDDGLPLDQERIGPLTIEGQRADIILVRVTDPESGPIWLISSGTLAKVPALHNAIEKTWLERVMPEVLLENKIFGVSLAQWIIGAASFAVPLLLLWLAARLSVILIRKLIADSVRRRRVEVWRDGIRWPTIILLSLVIHFASASILGSSLSFRITYLHFGLILVVLTTAWLLRRIAILSFEEARGVVKRRGQSGTESLLLLGERVFNVIIVIIAIFTILTIAGVDTKTAIAGVGIGGIAIALGAQKTVENLLGGIFLLSDRALAIGDTCCISNRVGTVEDITLRSVRLRTTEQTLLSIPAGALSQSNIENFATRRKILLQTKLYLSYETNVEQIGSVLSGIQHLLANNPDIERESAYIRLVDFGQRAIELELFAFTLTSNCAKFLTVRETLLLRIAEVVESAGSNFARPTQFVNLEPVPRRENPIDSEMRPQERAEAATKTIAKRAS